MRKSPVFLMLALLGLAVGGCGKTRAEGDPDGIPVTFVIHADQAFFSRMADHRASVSSGVGMGFGSAGMVGSGVGLGAGFQVTTIYLLGGAHPGEAGSFRHRLGWGETSFMVQLRSGRLVTLTVQAEGGRQGWETVGEFTVSAPDSDEVQVTLDVKGAQLHLK